MSDQVTIGALPQQSVQRLELFDRVLGRQVTVPVAPGDDGEVSPAHADLAGDVFHQLHRREPELLPVDQVPAGRQVNHKLLEWMAGSPGFQDAAATCAGSIMAARSSAGLLWQNLTSDEALQAALQLQEQAAEAEARAAELEALARGYQDIDPEQAQGHRDKALQLRQQATGLAGEASDKLDQQLGNPVARARLAATAEQAKQEARQINQELAGWGFGPGTATWEDPAEVLAFYEQLTPHARMIAEIAGRVRAAMAAARRTRVPSGQVPIDVEFTQDISRILPDQLIRLAPGWLPADRADALIQFFGGGLLGIKPAGDGDAAGDFVAGVDVSGSMRGGRDAVAKGIALGMAQAARDSDDYREYVLFSFSAGSSSIAAVRSTDGWREHLQWAGAGSGGGTDFNTALIESMIYMEDMDRPDACDLTIISDGIGLVDILVANDWRRLADQYGWRMLFIPVAYDDMGLAGDLSLAELADQVMSLAELDAQQGTDLARQALAGFYR